MLDFIATDLQSYKIFKITGGTFIDTHCKCHTKTIQVFLTVTLVFVSVETGDQQRGRHLRQLLLCLHAEVSGRLYDSRSRTHLTTQHFHVVPEY